MPVDFSASGSNNPTVRVIPHGRIQTPARQQPSGAVRRPRFPGSPSRRERGAPASTRGDEVAGARAPAAPRRPSLEPGLAVAEEAAYEAPPPEVMPAVQVAEPPAPAPEETQEVAAPAFTVESLP